MTTPKIEKYEATIKILGRISKNTDKSLTEAIRGLKVGNVKGIAVLRVQKGKKSKEKVLTPPMVSRLFNSSDMNREVALKHVTSLFENI